MNLNRWMAGLAVLLMLTGCTRDPGEHMGGGSTEAAVWDGVDDLESGPLMGASYGAETGNWKEVRTNVNSAEFKAGVDKLAASEIPSGGNAADRDAAVKALKDLIAAAAKSGSEAELKPAWDAAMAALKKMKGDAEEN